MLKRVKLDQPVHPRHSLSDKLQRLRSLHKSFGTVISSNYDVSDVCNLNCEGCLYFSGLNYTPRQSPESMEAWKRFFASEAARGVNYGYFAGAEPSLVPDVLRTAMSHIRSGVITTNGIKRISKDIRYRIHISLWGNESESKKTRGADNGRKALKNYRGDERAVAVYTINRRNIGHIAAVSSLCADHGIPITFSYFSPTDDYLARLVGMKDGKSDYFRVSSENDNIVLGRDEYTRAHEAIASAKDRYSDNVWYSLEYDRWVTQPAGLYQLDQDGVATDCGSRLAVHHRHFNVDMTMNSGKCCSPNIDCKSCRAYTNGYATLLSRPRQFARSDDTFEMWLDAWKLWKQIFLLEEHKLE